MTWLRWRRGSVIVVSSTAILLLIITSLIVVRGRRSDDRPNTTLTSSPATSKARRWTTPPLQRKQTLREPTRTVNLDITDAAALLQRLQTAAAAPDDVVRRVSRQLNAALRAFQQGRCLVRGADFTDTGAWCQRAVDSLHIIDRRLAATLAHFLAGTTVLSLGDGTGVYRQLILNTSKPVVIDQLQVKQYDSYDGAPFSEETTKGSVGYLDLSVPQLWLSHYDWVVCLEVVEHIPAKFESIVLDNVIRPAMVGVVLSWAVPTQPGAAHVNPRTLEYVGEQLRRRGLTPDDDATTQLRNGSDLSWFRRNIVVYRKMSAVSKPPS